MIEAYLSPTANCQRVSVMLECCDLPYRVHAVDRQRGEQREPNFIRLNPAAAVPVIIDPDGEGGERVVLAQSGAILIYLAEKTGRYFPAAGPERRAALQWFLQVLTDVNPAASAVLLMNKAVDANDETTEFFRTRLVKFLSDCSERLEANRFLAGEISIADIALYPVCIARNDVVRAEARFEPLRRWLGDMEALPGVDCGMMAI